VTTTITTEQWALEASTRSDDPDDLQKQWASKLPYLVDGRRSCAELAVLARLRLDGWDGFWLNAFERKLRQDWFPAPPISLGDVAPGDVAATFERLRTAKGGRLGGFLADGPRRPQRAARPRGSGSATSL
jgi:hypothetical protein